MTNYDTDALEEMCSKIDLLEYAENTMNFKRNGSDSFVTCCPLHTDKTPSLSICPSKNLFHCFSCGKSGSIIQWLMLFEHMSFEDAIAKTSRLAGVDLKDLRQCSCMKSFKEMKKLLENNNNEQQIERKILNPSILNQFSDEVPQEWIDEGISPESMKKYGVKVDNNANRIIYPVYDAKFNLIGIKGRTRYANHKILGIPKYMNYYKLWSTDFFQGMKSSFHRINELKKCLIFEGLKSVMKADSWGYDYSISSETSTLNDGQIKILIQMGIKEVTICFDSDVKIEKIIEHTKMLRKFCNVYVVTDRKRKSQKLLGEKEAPVDRGREVFETLLSERIKI